jgi:hypothetical protein
LTLHDRDATPNALTIPLELKGFSEPSLLLPGENRQQFDIIRDMLIDEIRPQTNIEWLWTLDLIELSWEILRYRLLKQSVLHEYRYAAIKAILLRLDGAGVPARDLEYQKLQAGRSAAEWRDDPQAGDEIEARLRRHGFDEGAVNAEIFCQARELFATFDELMHAAQNRRIVLLKEINSRRELTKRAVRSRPESLQTSISNPHQ